MPEHIRGKNCEIRHDLIMTAGYLQKLADALADKEEIIQGKFKMRRDVRRILGQAEKELYCVIQEITKDDIFRDITKVTAREILGKMRKYMLYLFKTEREEQGRKLFLEVRKNGSAQER